MLPTMALAIPECVSPPNENANDVVFVKKSRLMAPIPFWSTEHDDDHEHADGQDGRERRERLHEAGSSPCAAGAVRS